MQTNYNGQQDPNSSSSDFNAQSFLIRSLLSKISTATLVKVVKCTNTGGLSPVGLVDIQPLVNQLDGANNSVPHGVIYGCPYLRMQGGANAVIMDPQVGDIGVAVFADHDISSVPPNKTAIAAGTMKGVNPGGNRRFDMSDGLYLGGMLNAVPTQYVQFTSSGITVKSPTAVTIAAPSIKLENAGSALQTLLNSTLLTWLAAHVHTSATAGNPTSMPTTAPPATVSTTVTQAE